MSPWWGYLGIDWWVEWATFGWIEKHHVKVWKMVWSVLRGWVSDTRPHQPNTCCLSSNISSQLMTLPNHLHLCIYPVMTWIFSFSIFLFLFLFFHVSYYFLGALSLDSTVHFCFYFYFCSGYHHHFLDYAQFYKFFLRDNIPFWTKFIQAHKFFLLVPFKLRDPEILPPSIFLPFYYGLHHFKYCLSLFLDKPFISVHLLFF